MFIIIGQILTIDSVSRTLSLLVICLSLLIQKPSGISSSIVQYPGEPVRMTDLQYMINKMFNSA